MEEKEEMLLEIPELHILALEVEQGTLVENIVVEMQVMVKMELEDY